nr:DUF2335 domain-containing protein [uncultured Ottowia sp.]
MAADKKRDNKAQPAATVPAAANAQHVVAVGWEGPLPPPHTLAQFNEIIPHGAERIMVMAEKEQAHRHAMDAWIGIGGRVVGAVLLISCLMAAIWSVYLGADWRATGLFLSVPVLAAIGRFVPVRDRKE